MTTTDRPNWPDNDPRWLRATYNEIKIFLARLEAKLDAELARQAKQKEER